MPEISLAAFQAYNAMEATKERHLSFLKSIEEKYERYGEPSEAETDIVAQFLRDHDQMVFLFKSATQALREKDEVAHLALLKYIMLIQDQLA